MFPVRCYTCGLVIAHLYPAYRTQSRDAPSGKVLDDLRVQRICCRRMFLGHVDVVRDQLHHPNVDSVLDASRATVLRRSIRDVNEVSCD